MVRFVFMGPDRQEREPDVIGAPMRRDNGPHRERTRDIPRIDRAEEPAAQRERRRKTTTSFLMSQSCSSSSSASIFPSLRPTLLCVGFRLHCPPSTWKPRPMPRDATFTAFTAFTAQSVRRPASTMRQIAAIMITSNGPFASQPRASV